MQTLKGNHINLRALEPEDLDFLFQIENNENFWEVSHTQQPFSKYTLKLYIESAHLDIYETKQLRLVIESNTNISPIGMIDIFDFNPRHKRAGIGILIHPDYQNNGYASEALSLLIKYSFTYLQLHQLYANITEDNFYSIQLFKKLNFEQVGIKKDWNSTINGFKNEILFQLINPTP